MCNYLGIVSQNVRNYIESEIIPRYAAFDKAHNIDHVRMVINQSMILSERISDINPEMVYIVAAFHDLGLVNGREKHHIDSRRILESDEFVKAHFNFKDITLMGEAIEDHRASNGNIPHSIYGIIVAEADRYIDSDLIIRRTIQYGLEHYGELDKEKHYKSAIGHLKEKYGSEGYLKILIPWSDNANRLEELRSILVDKSRFNKIFNRIYNEEISL